VGGGWELFWWGLFEQIIFLQHILFKGKKIPFQKKSREF
jgi:hypothetical protein